MAFPFAMAGMAVLGAASAYTKGKGQIAQLKLEEDNLNLQADIAKSLGAFEAHLFRRKSEFERSGIITTAAASGQRLDTGSALDVLMFQAQNHKTEELQIVQARELQAWGLEQQAFNIKQSRQAAQKQLLLDVIGGALSFASVANSTTTAPALQNTNAGILAGAATDNFGNQTTTATPDYGATNWA